MSINLSAVPMVTFNPPQLTVDYSSWDNILKTSVNVSLVNPIPTSMFNSFSFDPTLESMIFG
jgi:hypothetical protein